ncbi:hypothetical protein HYW58_02770 [Candidatus Kaiserbacteria bacterium]|nr:hypothetical protein [Candidatus Kaiserbacteria bacterium]
MGNISILLIGRGQMGKDEEAHLRTCFPEIDGISYVNGENLSTFKLSRIAYDSDVMVLVDPRQLPRTVDIVRGALGQQSKTMLFCGDTQHLELRSVSLELVDFVLQEAEIRFLESIPHSQYNVAFSMIEKTEDREEYIWRMVRNARISTLSPHFTSWRPSSPEQWEELVTHHRPNLVVMSMGDRNVRFAYHALLARRPREERIKNVQRQGHIPNHFPHAIFYMKKDKNGKESLALCEVRLKFKTVEQST